mgnify:CR=1 FL=1
MAGNYYLLTSLPTLDALGAEPPMSAAEFAERVADADGPAEIVRAILLGDVVGGGPTARGRQGDCQR